MNNKPQRIKNIFSNIPTHWFIRNRNLIKMSQWKSLMLTTESYYANSKNFPLKNKNIIPADNTVYLAFFVA